MNAFCMKKNISRELCSEFVTDRFCNNFSKGSNPKVQLFLQDRDLSQNSRMLKKAHDKIPCRLLRILPRFLILKPIKNIFHLVGMCLNRDSIKKTMKRKSFQQFSNRVTNTIHNFPSHFINQTIPSMPK